MCNGHAQLCTLNTWLCMAITFAQGNVSEIIFYIFYRQRLSPVVLSM
jgi:hypothetical protein